LAASNLDNRFCENGQENNKFCIFNVFITRANKLLLKCTEDFISQSFLNQKIATKLDTVSAGGPEPI
jgi:hypothetical protein